MCEPIVITVEFIAKGPKSGQWRAFLAGRKQPFFGLSPQEAGRLALAAANPKAIANPKDKAKAKAKTTETMIV